MDEDAWPMDLLACSARSERQSLTYFDATKTGSLEKKDVGDTFTAPKCNRR